MSTTIDSQVVEMRFDNRHFENNVQTSLSTLQKLKQSLNMDGATKSLAEVEKASKKIDFSGFGQAVETVQAKFSALQVVGITALTNITNSAVNAGKRIASALTIDPIKSGFQEYETQINAVQTILANTESKGKTLSDVNKALDELNTYADKTIYNFTEMTRNIGTFTAAGVDLDTSVSAIKGIANLAAVSGSTSQQASTAMYQLSQAMASGTVKLMDWNSVVNAGMGGQVFQDALKETAKVHGIAIDKMIERDGSFRETLQHGWLTTEILTETLQKFTGDLNEEQLKTMGYTEEQIAGIIKMGETANNAATKVKTFTQLFDTLKEAAQSGWTQSWEIIVGDFEEAKELLTEISDTIGAMIGKSAENRNNLLTGWKDLGGREDVIDAFRNLFDAAGRIIAPIKEAFREIFPPTTAKQLHSLTAGLKNFTEKLKIGDATADKLKRTFKGVFALFDIGVQIIKSLFKGFAELVGFALPAGDGILSLTANIGDFIVGLRDGVVASDFFGKGIGKIVDVIKIVVGSIVNFAGAIKDMFGGITNIDMSGVEAFLDRVKERFGFLEVIGNGIKTVFLGIAGIFKFIAPLFTAVAKKIGEMFSAISEGLSSLLTDGDYNQLFDLFNGGLFAAIGIGIAKFVNGAGGMFDGVGDIIENAGGIVENFKDILGGVSDALGAFTQSLKADTLKKIAVAIAILAASLLVLSFIDSEKLTESLAAITVLFADLMGAMSIFGKIDSSGNGMMKATTVMIGMSIAILILSSAMKVLSTLDWEGVAKGLVGVAGLAAVVVASAKLMSSGEKKLIKGATSLVIFALAIKILASVCKDLSVLDWEGLSKGLVGVGVLLTEVAIFLKVAKMDKQATSTALGILILSAALKVLASVCNDFGNMSWGTISKGLVGIGALLLEVALFTKLTGNAKHVVSTALSLVLIGAAMKILASAISDMGSMSWETIGKGLLTMAGALAAITIAVNLMPKNMLAKSVALIGIATALLILNSSLSTMGSMSWQEIAKGLVMLAGSMTIIAVAMNFMKGALPGAAALLVITASLALFTPILKILGAMSIESIAKSLGMLAGVFLILGVAGAVLGPLVPSLLGLSGAIALLGVGCLAIGTGMVILAAGVASLGASLVALGGGIVLFVGELLAVFPMILKMIGAFVQAFLYAIADSAAALAKAVAIVVVAVVEALVDCVPVLADGVLKLIDSLLESLVQYTPSIVSSLFDLLIGLIRALADRLPELIVACVDLVMALFVGVGEALKNIDPKALMEGLVAVGILAGVIAALSAISGLIPSAMVGVLGAGVIAAELALVFAALGVLGQDCVWLIEGGGKVMEAIGTAIGRFVGGIIGGIAQGMTSSLPTIGSDLSQFMTNARPFLDGVKQIDNSTMSGVTSLVSAILSLTAANLLEGITSFLTGGSSISKFGKEIAAFGPCIRTFADSVAGMDTSSVKDAAEAGKILADMANTIPNEGGMASWFAGENSVAKFGDELISLGEGLRGFSMSVAGINPDAIVAAAKAGKALTEMASNIPNSGGMASWFAGDNSVANFGDELITLGQGLKGFASEVSGIDLSAIVAAGEAAGVLAKMTESIPNSGGMVSWFSGDNSIANFGKDLIRLGQGLKGFATEVEGVNPDAVVAASNAAKSLAEMTSHIPNSGGMASWFAGDNSVAGFSFDLILLGNGLKGFADKVSGINPTVVVAAANAAKSIADMTHHIPNSGGMVTWFTGDNSLSKFGSDMIALGVGLKSFSLSVTGINTEALVSATKAAESIAKMSTYIPNSGGMVSWFTGDNSLSKFGDDLSALGAGLKSFSTNVEGVDPETIVAASNAAKSLAEMTTHIPDSGGMVTWFTGDNSISKFGEDLKALGKGLKGFSNEVNGVDPMIITTAAQAAEALARMTAVIPNSDGMVHWFTGSQSISKFGGELKALGTGLRGFADEVSTIDSTSKVVAVAQAAESLAELTKHVPSTEGMAQWFTGTQSIATFGNELKQLGQGLAAFANEVAAIESTENVSKAVETAKGLAEVSKVVEGQGGFKLFGEKTDLQQFASDLEALGGAIVVFANTTKGITNIAKTSDVVDILSTISSITMNIPQDSTHIEKYGSNLAQFGASVANYFDHIGGISGDALTAAPAVVNALNDISKKLTPGNVSHLQNINGIIHQMVTMLERTRDIKKSDGEGFAAAMAELGTIGYDSFAASFEADDLKKRMHKAGQDAIMQFKLGLESTTYSNPADACSLVISRCIKKLEDRASEFYDAGAHLASGFGNGIASQAWYVMAKATALASAAAQAIRDALRINSPSKVLYEIGEFTVMGFTNALTDLSSKAEAAGSDLGRSSINGMNNAISRIASAINGDIDIQPTIRPVLDLTDVKSGANAIGSMLSGNRRLFVDSMMVDSVASMMSGYSGGHDSKELISSVQALRKDIANMPRESYTINGVTYDDGSNVANAVKTLVRAVKVERRT